MNHLGEPTNRENSATPTPPSRSAGTVDLMVKPQNLPI